MWCDVVWRILSPSFFDQFASLSARLVYFGSLTNSIIHSPILRWLYFPRETHETQRDNVACKCRRRLAVCTDNFIILSRTFIIIPPVSHVRDNSIYRASLYCAVSDHTSTAEASTLYAHVLSNRRETTVLNCQITISATTEKNERTRLDWENAIRPRSWFIVK